MFLEYCFQIASWIWMLIYLSTIPAPSCPMAVGVLTMSSPNPPSCQKWTSDPQIPTESILIRTSLSLGSGIGVWLILKSFALWTVTVKLLAIFVFFEIFQATRMQTFIIIKLTIFWKVLDLTVSEVIQYQNGYMWLAVRNYYVRLQTRFSLHSSWHVNLISRYAYIISVINLFS